MMNQMTKEGIALIKKFEGCRLSSYRCSADVWTVGFGHTRYVYSGMKIKPDQAEAFLMDDLNEAIGHTRQYVETEINDNQFSSLVSFVFNAGAGALHKSTLLKKLNARDFFGAANEFLKWDHAGGKIVDGLTRRRFAERELFLTPPFGSNQNADVAS